MAENISAALAWQLADAVRSMVKGKTGPSTGTATFVGTDSTGRALVLLPGADQPTPVHGAVSANAEVGSTVTYSLANGQLSITGNASDPAVGESKVTEITAGAIKPLEVAQRTAEAATDAARRVADAASNVANAINQHFFADDNGIHVTQVTQEEWAESQTGPNVLINSIGQLFRDGMTNLLSLLPAQTQTDTFEGDGSTTTYTLTSAPASMASVSVGGTTTTAYTVSGTSIIFSTAPSNGASVIVTYYTNDTAMVVWDGMGNAAANVLASFGKVIRIGYELAGNTEITSNGMRIKYATDRLYEVSTDGERVTIYTGGSTAASGMDYTDAYLESLVTWLNDSCRVVQVGGKYKVLDSNNRDTQLIVSDWDVYTNIRFANILDASGNDFMSGTYARIYYCENGSNKVFELDIWLTPQSEVPTAPVHVEMGKVAMDLANKRFALSSENLAVKADGSVSSAGDMSIRNMTMHGRYGQKPNAPGNPPTSFQYHGGIESFDSTGDRDYYSQTGHRPDDILYRSFVLCRTVNGSQVTNGFYLRIAANGTKSVTFTSGDEALWRTALGLGSYGPTSIPLSSATKAYSAYQTPKYRKCGDVVNVYGAVSPKSEVAAGGSLTIGSLPSGYRPSINSMWLCQGSGNAVWMLTINDDGSMTASRYRSGASANAAIPTNAWLIFNVTYIVD